MDRVTLQNYRCFREKQSARLAPLTFLVGENSTGKTSFLALLRALWQVAFQDRVPDFRQPPYDLGAFEDVVNYRGGRDAAPDSFEAGITYVSKSNQDAERTFNITFKDRGGYPFPYVRSYLYGERWFEVRLDVNYDRIVRFGDLQNQYMQNMESGPSFKDSVHLVSLESEFTNISDRIYQRRYRLYSEDAPTTAFSVIDEEINLIGELVESLFEYDDFVFGKENVKSEKSPFASAPIRSRPRRTYDPSRPTPDPEGEYIPDYLTSMSRNAPDQWERLKSDLEDFGRDSGLFDEIAVLSFGKTAGAPFQIQIRKFGKRLKGPKRNLIDVGYGVSQALPILTELMHENSPEMFLLQQPEVHLHPRAQAALGSLFCNLAASGKQIIVETHSDYIIDRARMDIRDGKTGLKPDDISILYFERDELDVNIHSIRMDEDGNFWDAPPGYRRFFSDETRRYIGL